MKASLQLSLFVLLSLLIASCVSPPQGTSNFLLLQEAVSDRDASAFCQNISRSSREAIGSDCRRSLSTRWRELEKLFEEAEPLQQKNNIFFIRKEGQILSYSLEKDGGTLKANIVGDSKWEQ